MSQYLRWVPSQCPYCDHKNQVRLDVNAHSRHVITCDADEGGCDKDYIVHTAIILEVQTYVIIPADQYKEQRP